jgi:hypothetical protein
LLTPGIQQGAAFNALLATQLWTMVGLKHTILVTQNYGEILQN